MEFSQPFTIHIVVPSYMNSDSSSFRRRDIEIGIVYESQNALQIYKDKRNDHMGWAM